MIYLKKRLEEEKETSYSLFAKLERQALLFKVQQEENRELKISNEENKLENTLLRDEVNRCHEIAFIERKKCEKLVPTFTVENTATSSSTKLTTAEVVVTPTTIEKPLKPARRPLKRSAGTSADTQKRK